MDKQAIILAIGKKMKDAKKGTKPGSSDTSSSSDYHSELAQSILEAIDDKDPEALAQHLKDFYDECSGGDGTEE